MKTILVTGANGQLGKCLQKLAPQFERRYKFHFAGSDEVDITNPDSIEEIWQEIRPQYCINAAAYTAVDLAEEKQEKAFGVNAGGVANLAEICRKYRTTLIHVSTDYVFNGESEISYSEDNFTDPQSVYGASKRAGEEAALEIQPQTIILRTSWLYSEFNKNFVKSMLHLFSVKDELGIVADQYGQPTNANDLAAVIMEIIGSERKTYGIFHFSNSSETTWFEFATAIAKLSDAKINIKPITTADYPTAAKRPRRSTMALDKIEEAYGIQSRHWEYALEDCLEELKAAEA